MNLSFRPRMLGQVSESSRLMNQAVDRYLEDRYHDLPEQHVKGDSPPGKKYPWWLLLAVPVGLYLTMKV